jgi:hypothetical protein
MADEGFGWWAALKWAWSNKTEILGHLTRVREWFRSDPGRGILIIGAGGVGKTTLASILAGTFDWLTSNPWEYQENYGTEQRSLADDPKVKIVIPPGQLGRREAYWADVESNLANGQYRGVIIVNANGYHTLPQQSYKTHTLYKGNKDDFLTAYFNACRADELAVLKRVATSLQRSPTKTWLLSVVAKEDLWWADRDQVETFYGGAYAEMIAAITSVRGATRFRHESVRASLVINNFQSGEGELLVKNTAGYDHRQQAESVRRLFEALNALREWEES